jgi:hypothetical protein
MASAARAKVLLDSLDEKVEGLKEAVDKLSAAAKQVSDDQGQGVKVILASSQPAALSADQSASSTKSI